MKKIVLLFIFSLSCFRFVGATGQCGEVIIIGRDTLQLLACPIGMDSVLSGMVNERTDKDGFCTGCWRGYVGWWRLENNTLYLEKLVDYHRSSEDKEVCIDTEGIFDAYKQDGKIVASWFSGIESRQGRGYFLRAHGVCPGLRAGVGLSSGTR